MIIRDPVHGDVSLTAAEAEVLDLAEVQRLRGIKQLGTAYFVYPGAVHTRFDHSLGVNALAKRIMHAIRGRGIAIDAQLETVVGIAALLHDVTHVPFGHTLEDERRLFPRHDKGERFAQLLGGALGEALRRLGMRDMVAAVFGVGGAAIPAWVRDIVASTIDADLLDYVRRDSYFAGLAHNYDDRIFRHFTIAGDRLAINMTKHGMERPDARSETVQLLRMRYFLTERVYYHHTKVAAGAMVSKAVELAHRDGMLSEADLLQLTDCTLLQRLATASTAAICRIAERLARRDLLKRAYVLSAASVPENGRRELVRRFHASADQRRQAEDGLAREIGCDAADVVVYCPAFTVMKEAAALVCTPAGVHPLNAAADEHGSEITALEVRYAGLWRFYVLAPRVHVARAAAAAAALFGYSSEHIVG